MKEVYRCHLCSEKFHSLNKLSVHIERQHEGFRERKKKTLKCNLCGHEFSTARSLMNHMRKHTGERPFKCTVDDCGVAFKRQCTLSNHIKHKHSDDHHIKCEFPGCLYTNVIQSKLIQHKKKHSDERPFACPSDGCSFRCKRNSEITHHVKRIHMNTPAETFACSKCDYKTANSGHLKKHMKRHSTRKDFKCSHPQCTESFKNSIELKSDFSNRHGERNMQCDHPNCGRKYGNAKALNAHKRGFHSTERHVCPEPECNFSTNVPRSLVCHMIVHYGKNEQISCSIEGCKYRAKNSKAMKTHMHRHKKRLPCPVSSCGQFVPTEDALKNHLKLHSPSGRPFQCPLCYKHYGTLDKLHSHCVVHTNEKPFKCGHCVFAAPRQASIKTHISGVHPKIQFPFIVHLLDDRECLSCGIILPSSEFVVHSKGHESLVVKM